MRRRARAPQRLGLRVRPAPWLRRAVSYDDGRFALLAHNDRADRRVRPDIPQSAPAERERERHETPVGGRLVEILH